MSQTQNNGLPRHVAIIMDGNGRWAKKRMLPRTMGHKKGAETFGKIARYCRDLKIPYLTAYAFSTENWKRPKEEIDAIMDLLRHYLSDVFHHQDENARLCFLGDLEPLDEDIRETALRIQRESAQNQGITINIALNYGGRDEIIHAARNLAKRCMTGELSPNDIDEALFSEALYTAGQPDPDLIIRPSGECRTSNFLPWQGAYAELVFMDVLWPDFKEADFDRALEIYQSRSRRFGGI